MSPLTVLLLLLVLSTWTPGTALASHRNSIWSWCNSKGQTPLWLEARSMAAAWRAGERAAAFWMCHCLSQWTRQCNCIMSSTASQRAATVHTANPFWDQPRKSLLVSVGQGIAKWWGSLNTSSAGRENLLLLATAFDPRFRELKFVAAEDGTRVQGTVEILGIKKTKETGIHECNSEEQQKVMVPG